MIFPDDIVSTASHNLAVRRKSHADDFATINRVRVKLCQESAVLYIVFYCFSTPHLILLTLKYYLLRVVLLIVYLKITLVKLN